MTIPHVVDSSKQELLAYIPMDRRHALAKGEQLAEYSTGSVMFADISGFTPLTVKLTQALGQKFGAETLTFQLNEIYDRLVISVHHFHGSVITYAGDAMTCWFDGDDGSAALGCALAMQESMLAFEKIDTPDGGSVSLSIKISIAHGQVRRFIVGDEDIQLVDVIAGKTLDIMAKAEKMAERREIVLDQGLAERLANQIELKEWREEPNSGLKFGVVAKVLTDITPNPWPELDKEHFPSGALSDWTLPPVYHRLEAGQSDFLTETRPTAIIFHNFTGFDFDGDVEAPNKLDQFIRSVQHVFQRYEGFLLQLLIGYKGSFIYGAFGAPIAHTDDIPRAIAASKELQELSNSYSYVKTPRTGVSFGQVLTGPYGGRRRKTYGLLGSEVNIAARFMSEASEFQVVARQTVAETISSFYRTRQLGQAYVKGIRRSIGMYEVLDRIPQEVAHLPQQFATKLVGRENELNSIRPIISDLAEGHGHIIEIVGQPGIGKTHLGAEIMEMARRRGSRNVLGRCQNMTQSQPFTPWRQILRSLLGIPPETGFQQKSRSTLARLIAQLQVQITFLNPDWGLRLPLLGDLLGLEIPDNETTEPLEPKMRQDALFALVADMLAFWAEEEPLLVMFDDITWMDELSLALTRDVMRICESSPILLVLVHRPTIVEEPLIDLSEIKSKTVIGLDLLSRDAIGRQISNLLHGEAAPIVVDLINRQAQGNPYFAEELINFLSEGRFVQLKDGIWELSLELQNALNSAGAIEQRDEHWRLTDEAKLPENVMRLPDSIYGSILARLDRLTEAQKLTLKVASVVGYAFDIDLVNQVHPTHPEHDQLTSQVESLTEQDFIFKQQTDRDTTIYLFRQGTTRDVTYDTLLDRQKRLLHRIIADTISRLSPGDVEEIALHASLGHSWDVALYSHWQSAVKARQIFANNLALDHLKMAHQCIKQLKSPSNRSLQRDMFLLLGEVWLDTGENEKSEAALKKALAVTRHPDAKDAAVQARILRFLARVHERHGDLNKSLEFIKPGKRLLEGQMHVELTELQLLEGLILSRQGELKQAQAICMDAIESADMMEDKNTTARGYTLMGHLSRMAGDGVSAVEYQEKALKLYIQTKNLHGEGIVQNQLANGFFQVSRWDDAAARYRRAIVIFDQTGNRYHRAFANNNLGQLYLYQGRFVEAQAEFESALQMLQKLGASQYVLGVVRMNLGAAALARNEFEASEEQFSIAESYFEEAGAREFLSELFRYKSLRAMKIGDLSTAREIILQSLQLAKELGMRQEEGIAWRVCADIAYRGGVREPAFEMINKSVEILSSLDDRFELAKSQLSMARLYMNSDTSLAGKNLRAALETFTELGANAQLAEAGDVVKAFRSKVRG
ncbi:MAG: tetratricopeptide repeat protein [Chloroflexota bacterium]